MTTKTDFSNTELTSRSSPTDDDMKVWDSLSAENQKAMLMRDIKRGLESPSVAVTKDQLMKEALENRLK